MALATCQPCPPLSDDLIFRNAHIGKKDFVEIGSAGHIHKRSDFNAGRVHVKKQKGDALVLWRLGLCSNQAKNPIADVRRAGPDFLTIDDPLIAVEFRFGGEASKVTAPRRVQNNP